MAQIAKSVIFRARSANQPVLVIASGVNRVDEKKLEAALGDKIGRADADFVRAATGFAIGGVAPVGHTGPVTHIHRRRTSTNMTRSGRRPGRPTPSSASPRRICGGSPAAR